MRWPTQRALNRKIAEKAEKMRKDIAPQVREKRKQDQEKLKIELQKLQRERRRQWLDI